MKTQTNQSRNFRPAIRRVVIAFSLVSMMGGMCITPAHARDNDDRRGHADKGWHKGEWRGDRRDWGPAYRPVYRDPYYYSQPVYAPAPIYYPPAPSPGISFFFPLDVRIR